MVTRAARTVDAGEVRRPWRAELVASKVPWRMPSSGRAVRWTVAAALVCFTLSGLYTIFGIGRPGWGWLFNDVIFDATYFLGAASCFIRSTVPDDEARGWRILAIGCLATGGSSVFFSLDGTLPGAEIPSLALRLLAYAPFMVGVVFLTREFTGIGERRFLLDAAALTIGMISALFVVVEFDWAATNFANAGAVGFVLCDLALAGVALAALFESGRHPMLLLFSFGLLNAVMADIIFALQEGAGTYRQGATLDQLWQVAAMITVVAPWVRRDVPVHSGESRVRVVIVPIASIMVSTALAAVVLAEPGTAPARGLVGGCIAACVALALVRIVGYVRQMARRLDVASTAAATLAHELRQPVTAARNTVAQMIPQAFGDEASALREVDEYLAAIASRTRVVEHCVVPADPGVLVARVVDNVARKLGTPVEVVIPSDLHANVDAEVAETVVRNLAANALEHGRPPIRIEAIRHRDRVELVIVDGGDGIALDPPSLAFELGQSRHDDVDRGVGLALARALARAAGGDVFYSPTPACPGRFVARFRSGGK